MQWLCQRVWPVLIAIRILAKNIKEALKKIALAATMRSKTRSHVATATTSPGPNLIVTPFMLWEVPTLAWGAIPKWKPGQPNVLNATARNRAGGHHLPLETGGLKPNRHQGVLENTETQKWIQTIPGMNPV